MVGQGDPGDYGKLILYTMTKDVNGTEQRNRDVDGPLTQNSQMLSATVDNISQQLSLLNQNGTRVDLGNLLIVPLDRGLLYVRPVYVRSTTGQAVPTLRKVIVSIGDQVHMGDTLQQALQLLFPTANITTREGGPDSGDGGATTTTTPPAGEETTTTTTTPGSTATTTPGSGTGATDPAALLQQIQGLLDQLQQQLSSTTTTTTTTTTQSVTTTTGKA
jgi:hypothetical protein